MKVRKRWRQALHLGWLFLALLPACRQDKNQSAVSVSTNPQESMKATIQRLHAYPNIPSASGMERIGNQLYVIGDDSPLLYVLDLASLKQVGHIRLFESNDFGSGRIPKPLKPDLECLTLLDIDGQDHLAAFGSGSAPNRARGYTIRLPAGKQEAAQVRQYSLQDLYMALQADKDLLGNEVLNLEAAATTPDQVLLLQRAAQAGPNLLLSFNKPEFVAYFTQSRKGLPAYRAIPFHLPTLAGLEARFSGATVHDNRLFFTASVENTTDAILDGEVMGSFIGWIALAALQPDAGPLRPHTALVLNKKGEPYKGKIESLLILDSPRAHTFRALAITDNDQGQSELLELELSTEAGASD
jgi:hypothetical protein